MKTTTITSTTTATVLVLYHEDYYYCATAIVKLLCHEDSTIHPQLWFSAMKTTSTTPRVKPLCHEDSTIHLHLTLSDDLIQKMQQNVSKSTERLWGTSTDYGYCSTCVLVFFFLSSSSSSYSSASPDQHTSPYDKQKLRVTLSLAFFCQDLRPESNQYWTRASCF